MAEGAELYTWTKVANEEGSSSSKTKNDTEAAGVQVIFKGILAIY